MTDIATTPTRLEMRWVQVTDEGGRARMEARWLDPAAETSSVRAA